MHAGLQRYTIPLLALLIPVPVTGAESYYVAVDGDDKYTGTIDQPFASVQRAQEAVSPGDTVFIRRNNLSFGSRRLVTNLHPTENDTANNAFDSDGNRALTEQDFESLDEAQLKRPRQPSGDLPEMTFLHLRHNTDQGAFDSPK